MPDFSIGVDLGGTNLRIAAVSRDGELLEKIRLETNAGPGRDYLVGEMCAAIKQLSEKYKATGNFLGVGLGVPGLIDLKNGVMRLAANLPGFENYPIRRELEHRLNAQVFLENDARAAAFGEQWLGAARCVENMAILTLGTGIGGGMILGGQIWHGSNGMAGEFGHVTVEPDGDACGCGNRGCSERYASASSIVRMAREAVAAGQAPALAKAMSSQYQYGARLIYELALEGDRPAQTILQTFGRYLGILLADLVNVLDLDMFVLGGGVLGAWDVFAPSMFAELRRRSVVYATAEREEISAGDSAEHCLRKTVITRALLGSDAGLFGAARLAIIAK